MSASLPSALILAVFVLTALAAPARAYPLEATPAERAARPQLERIEADIRFLEFKLGKQGDVLAGMAAESAALARERLSVESRRSALAERVGALLPALWDLKVRLAAVDGNASLPWDEAGRNLEWTGAAFEDARRQLALLDQLDRELAAAVARQAGIGPRERAGAEAAEALRDRLLAERLKLLDALTALRRENPPPAGRLERILEQVSLAGLSPFSALDRPMEGALGRLPLPVDGRPVQALGPEESPPRAGVGFATAKEAPVRAVHWGRVAFAGEVRGLGLVAVVAHGGNYASVYAHLSRLDVRPGQEVARGDAIGACGTLPPGENPGMSFELRFGLKPINPSRWLPAG